nr:retrovirus-related Pol polyprotein from transposon TNT 1-94 [Tanacetum cinerariifolium]
MCLIQSLESKELVRNLPKLKFDQHFCDACKIGKQAYASQKAKNIVLTTRCLELLHMDLFSLSFVRSYKGNRYTLVIVDDYYRKIKESLNVTLDETYPPSKTSPLVDDDLDEEEAIKITEKKKLEKDIEEETLDIDEILDIKESRNHLLENIIGNLNQRTFSVLSKGRYKTTPPSPNVVKSFIQIPRQGQATRTKNKKTIVVDKNEILTREIQPHMKPWVDIICENIICLGGHKDHVSAYLCHTFYCIDTYTRYNPALFIRKRMEKTRNKPKELLPYGMLLTRLFKHVVPVFIELIIDYYISHNRVIHPLASHYKQNTQLDHGKKRPHESNASSSSTTLNPPSFSHPLDDTIDENDDESFHSNSSFPS